MAVKDIVCDGLLCVVSGLGKYLGVWLGPASAHALWRDATRKLLSRALRIKLLVLSTAPTPVAYNYFVASVRGCLWNYFDPKKMTIHAEHITIVVVDSAPMYALSPDIASCFNLAGAWVACAGIARMAWASKIR